MTREDLLKNTLNLAKNNNRLILEWCTGVGKQYKYFTYPIVHLKIYSYICLNKKNKYGKSKNYK